MALREFYCNDELVKMVEGQSVEEEVHSLEDDCNSKLGIVGEVAD